MHPPDIDANGNVNLQLHLKAREQAASAINSLQTALFTTVTLVVASGIVGVLVGFKDFSSGFPEFRTYPGILIVVVGLWGIGLFLAAVATCIFIECIVYGFRIIQIERDLAGSPVRHGEAENFVPNDQSGFWSAAATQLYYPGLLASGLTHRYFAPLLVSTLLLATVITAIQYALLAHCMQPNAESSYYSVYVFLTTHGQHCPLLGWLAFLLVCLSLVPRLTPNNRQVARSLPWGCRFKTLHVLPG